MKSVFFTFRQAFLILALLSLFFLSNFQKAHASTYTLTPIDVPGATMTVASGISGNKIVGHYSDPQGNSYGFLFDGTTYTTIIFPSSSGSYPTGIDGNNIVGFYWYPENGFLHDGTSYQSIVFPGATTTYPYDIDGSNIVGYYRTPSTNPRGFIFNGSTFESIEFPGATETIATGISGTTIVGIYQAPASYNGFVYDGSTYKTLNVPNALETQISGIDGTNIVGTYWDSSSVPRGFLYNGTHFQTLDFSPGPAIVSGISGNRIIGYYWDSARSTYTSFVATKTADAQQLFVQQGGPLVGAGEVQYAAQGCSLSLSADGNTAIVGGYEDNLYLGAAWIFTRDEYGVWNQQGNKLVGTGAAGAAMQGSGVALSADGNTAIVGGPGDGADTIGQGVGAAWVFTRDANGVWSQQGNKLVGTGAVGNSMQGGFVSLSGNGNTAIVNGSADNNNTGAAWVFTRGANGIWSQQGNKLVVAGLRWQRAVLSADGNTAIMIGDDNNGAPVVWLFTRDTNGVWIQGSNVGFISDLQGVTGISFSADMNTAFVNQSVDGLTGAVSVFTRGNDGVWSRQGNQFFFSGRVVEVSLSVDGNTAVVGLGDSGVQLMKRNASGIWIQGNKLLGTDGQLIREEHLSLSGDGNTAIIGFPTLERTLIFVSAGTTTAGSNVTVQPVDPTTGTAPVTVTFSNVDTSGITSVITTTTGTTPPSGFMLGDPSLFYNIDTTAAYSGSMHICINYSSINFGTHGNLRLFHWSSTTNSWQNVTDDLDTENNVICGTVTSLSVFGVFAQTYNFSGFLPPVVSAANPPVFNSAKAGSTVPVKWQLTDANGYISDLSTVTSVIVQQVQCDLSAALTTEVPSTSGSSGLRYDTTANQFIFNWKTTSSMALKCYELTLTLSDGEKYRADFSLK